MLKRPVTFHGRAKRAAIKSPESLAFIGEGEECAEERKKRAYYAKTEATVVSVCCALTAPNSPLRDAAGVANYYYHYYYYHHYVLSRSFLLFPRARANVTTLSFIIREKTEE